MEWFEKLTFLDRTYLLILSVVLVIFIIKYNKVQKNIRPLLLFVIVHFLLELSSDYLFYALNRDNLILYHLFAPIGYIILCAFFWRTFADTKYRYYVLVSIPIYLVIVSLYTLLWEPVTRTNSLAYMTESLLIIYFCFTFFRVTLVRHGTYRPEQDPTFWIIIGILFFFIGNFFTIGSLNYFEDIKRRDLITKVYYAGYAFNYLLYVTISIVLLIDFSKYKHE